MHILVVNDFAYVNGGASQVAIASARGLARSGHRVTFFAAVGAVDPLSLDAGIDTVILGQQESISDPNRLRAATQAIWNSYARHQMRRLLTSLRPADTVVHVHTWVKALSTSVIREAIDRGFLVFCTLHDYFSVCPNGGFFDYQLGKPCGEVALSLSCVLRNCDQRSYPQKLWRVARHVTQRVFGDMPSGIKHFISVSDFSERVLKPYLPAGSSIDRLDNPIDSIMRQPVEVEGNDTFLFVGRLAPEKGVVDLATAVRNTGVRAVFVGDGPEVEKVRTILPNAEITGWLSRDEVFKRFRAARAIVMPSLWYETHGLVISEAAASGVPAIVSDRCAAREVVQDGQTGLWFAGGNINDLGSKIMAISKSGVAGKFGATAFRRYWTNPMTIERHVLQLESIYKRYLSLPYFQA